MSKLAEQYIDRFQNPLKDFLLAMETDNLVTAALEWIGEGWGFDTAFPTVEQLAAALLMEATTQDDCVKEGESAHEYPETLRHYAFGLLMLVGHVPNYMQLVQFMAEDIAGSTESPDDIGSNVEVYCDDLPDDLEKALRNMDWSEKS